MVVNRDVNVDQEAEHQNESKACGSYPMSATFSYMDNNDKDYDKRNAPPFAFFHRPRLN